MMIRTGRYKRKRIGLWLMGALAFSLPFELTTAVASLGPLTITNVELLLGVTLLAGLLSWLTEERRPLPRYWAWLGLFCLLAGIAILFAPDYRANAAKATLRLYSGVLLALTTNQLVHSRRDGQWIGVALLAGGTIAILPGMVESIANRPLVLLTPFRDFSTVVGQFIRLTGTFDYANQAAMFIEATIGFWVLYLAYARWHLKVRIRDPRYWLLLTLFGLGLLLYLEASFLTLSRTSWVTIGLVSLIMSFLAGRKSPYLAQLWLGVATAVVILFLINTALFDVFRLRLQSEADDNWYNLQMTVPERLEMNAGETAIVTIRLTNNGLLTWRSDLVRPINLGAYWLNANTKQAIGQPRWSFPQPIAPGDTITLTIPVHALDQSGDYFLQWDVVQEEVLWFSEKNGQTHLTEVTITAPTSSATAVAELPTEPTPSYPLPIPGRRVLWATAFELWAQRPLFGIGLDNFRLTYGAALGADEWNETIHTNNWYIEMLVSVGLLSSLPFFIWLAVLCMDLIQTIRSKTQALTQKTSNQSSISHAQLENILWQMAVAAGLLAFMIHGMLDFFLLFNATGLLFWLLAGLWAGSKSCA